MLLTGNIFISALYSFSDDNFVLSTEAQIFSHPGGQQKDVAHPTQNL